MYFSLVTFPPHIAEFRSAPAFQLFVHFFRCLSNFTSFSTFSAICKCVGSGCETTSICFLCTTQNITVSSGNGFEKAPSPHHRCITSQALRNSLNIMIMAINPSPPARTYSKWYEPTGKPVKTSQSPRRTEHQADTETFRDNE